MGQRQIKTVLIASGGGTDANSIMEAYMNGQIPNVKIEMLISTKKDAGCLDKAKKFSIPTCVLDRRELEESDFNRQLMFTLTNHGVKLVFLVGCLVLIEPIEGITFYNIHPANMDKFGGKSMYGLEVHKRVLLDIKDLIKRERKTINGRFFTTPTVHEANGKFDDGAEFLKASIEIPTRIVIDFMSGVVTLEESALRLQQHVLPYEWDMLPLAVKMAAKKIINGW